MRKNICKFILFRSSQFLNLDIYLKYLINSTSFEIITLILICLYSFNLRLTFAQSSLNLYSIYTQRSLNSFFFRFLSFSRARPPPEPYNVKRIFQLLSNS